MKQHSFDIISAGFGALFIWLGIAELAPQLSVEIAIVWPIFAVAIGVSLLVSAIRREQQEDA